MTPFNDHSFLAQQENILEQVRQLQHAIQDGTHKLEEVQQRRLRAEEEIMQCTRETEQRVDLILERSGVVDVLQQLGRLLQREKDLAEQLNGQASADRSDLQERHQCVTDKVRSLAAETEEVKQRLAEAKTRNIAAQALIHGATSKSRRNQGKPK